MKPVESFTFKAFVGSQYRLTKTTESAQKGPGALSGIRTPVPCSFLLAQTPNSLSSVPERRHWGPRDLESGRHCRNRDHRMNDTLDDHDGEQITNRPPDVSFSWVEQDPPVLEQGGGVPEKRKHAAPLTGVEQVEQGNYVSVNKGTISKEEVEKRVEYALEMRVTCIPCSTCSTTPGPPALGRISGTTPPCSTLGRFEPTSGVIA